MTIKLRRLPQGASSGLAILGLSLAIVLLRLWLVPSSTFVSGGLGDDLSYKDGAFSLYQQGAYLSRSLAGDVVRYLPGKHFPPLYSLYLSPSFLLGADFFSGMLVGNVVATLIASLLMFLTLQQIAGKSLGWEYLLLLLLLPIHAYNHWIASENLLAAFLALAIFCIYHPFASEVVRYSLFGSALAGACLSRYIAIPICCGLGVWFVFRHREQFLHFSRAQVGRLLSAMVVFSTPWMVWLRWTAQGESYGPTKFVEKMGYLDFQLAELQYLGLWFILYAAFVWLAGLPAFCVIIRGAFAKGGTNANKELAVFCSLLLLGITLVAARHSSVVSYNHPSPSHIMGRYVAIVIPVLFMWALQVLHERDFTAQPKRYSLFAYPLVALITWGAYWLVNSQSAWFLQSLGGVGASPFAVRHLYATGFNYLYATALILSPLLFLRQKRLLVVVLGCYLTYSLYAHYLVAGKQNPSAVMYKRLAQLTIPYEQSVSLVGYKLSPRAKIRHNLLMFFDHTISGEKRLAHVKVDSRKGLKEALQGLEAGFTPIILSPRPFSSPLKSVPLVEGLYATPFTRERDVLTKLRGFRKHR